MITTKYVSIDEFLSTNYTYTDFFLLKSSEKEYRVCLNFSNIKKFKNMTDIKEILHPDEHKYFETLKFSRRINSYLLGRYSAKKAISELTGEDSIKKILIKNGVFNQPIVVCDSYSNIHVSLTHSDDLAAAVAFSDMLVLGIDIEKVSQQINRGVEVEITQNEKGLAYSIPYSYECFLLMIWTIKESISKTLKTGFTIPLNILEVSSIEALEGYFISTFKNFPQYISISFVVEDYVCSITYPKNVEIDIDISRIMSGLHKVISAELVGASAELVGASTEYEGACKNRIEPI